MQMYLRPSEIRQIKKNRLNYTNRRKKWFEQKRLNHMNNKRLKDFTEKYLTEVVLSEKLLEIRFKSSFAVYLYLYLKSLAVPYETEHKSTFTISQPLPVNIEHITKMTKLVRNTVKKAFYELIRVGLVMFRDDLKAPYHNSIKTVMLLNDMHLIGFDENSQRVVYSINSKNFNEE